MGAEGPVEAVSTTDGKVDLADSPTLKFLGKGAAQALDLKLPLCVDVV